MNKIRWDIILSVLTALGICLAFQQWGYTIGKDQLQESYDYSISQNEDLKIEKEELKAKIVALEDANGILVFEKESLTNELSDLKVASLGDSNEIVDELGSNNKENNNSPIGRVENKAFKINEGNSIYNDKTGITISLISVEYEGEPRRYKAYFNASGNKGELETKESADVGTILYLEDYMIIITDVEYSSANFIIRQKT